MLLLLTSWTDRYTIIVTMLSQRAIREKLFCDPYCYLLLLFLFDCIVEISRDTFSLNAYVIGSERITPTLSTLDATATVLENKVQEILHDIYRTFKCS